MRPPRALWVPFVLGRPFGVPNDADFQRDVLRAALALLERTDGPVILDDFPRDAPRVEPGQAENMFCPVAFGGEPADPNDPVAAVHTEVQRLAPWYEQALLRHKGRTTVGLSRLPVEGMVEWLAQLHAGGQPEPIDGLTTGQSLRFVVEDLRSWYSEAVVAQPGANPDPTELANWFWGKTSAGALLVATQAVAASHDDQAIRFVGRMSMVPRSQHHRLQGAG